MGDLYSKRTRFIGVSVFFLVLFGLGLAIYRDYGVSWDELTSRDNGMITLKYIGERFAPSIIARDPAFIKYTIPLAEYVDRDYGVAFEAPVSLLERLFQLETMRDRLFFRHLMTFLVCFGGCIAMFQLAERRFSTWLIGLLGALWLVLSPRLFADFFYNDKDAVFMAMFAISTNTAVRFLLRPTLGRAAWHALACALTIDVRIVGVLLPVVSSAFLLIRMLQGQVNLRSASIALGCYVLLTIGLVVLFWPFLWAAPLTNFHTAFENMKKFRWEGYVLYRSEVWKASELPWHYVLGWLSVTTPVLYLVAFILGVCLTIRQMLRRVWRLWETDAEMQDVLFLALFAGPLLSIAVFHSVLYTGWRQAYFVYPAFLLVGLRGWVAAWRWHADRRSSSTRVWQRIVLVGTSLCLVATASIMVQAHPFQNAYFNALARKPVEERYEVDYWGLSFRKGFEYILAHDARPQLKVYVPVYSSGRHSIHLLTPEQQQRLVFVDKIEDADYFLTTYWDHREPYDYPHEVYRITAGGVRVLSAFKLRW